MAMSNKMKLSFTNLKFIMIIKNRSHRYNINRLRSRHRHKDINYMNGLSMVVLKCVKQYLSNISSSIDEKVKQPWGWVEKALLTKKVCILIAKSVSQRHAARNINH